MVEFISAQDAHARRIIRGENGVQLRRSVVAEGGRPGFEVLFCELIRYRYRVALTGKELNSHQLWQLPWHSMAPRELH
ncbi:hypothetical protein A0U87_13005 [Sphingobium sp. MP9-4]|nr:hypothetical protein A0U87_13005 [Sphingobium sp. MP9-4]